MMVMLKDLVQGGNEQATREVYVSSRKKTFPCIVLGYVYMLLIPCCLFPFFSVK